MLTVVPRTAPGQGEKPREIVRGESSRMPWAWNGLCFAMPGLEASTAGLRDVAGLVAPSALTNVAYAVDVRRNPVVNLDNAGAQVQYPDTPTHDRPSTALSVYARVLYKASVNSDAFGWIAGNYYAATAPFITWLLGSGVDQGHSRFVVTISGTDQTTPEAPTILPTGTWINLFGRWRTGEVLRMSHLYDGGAQQQADATNGPFSGTISYAAGQGIWLGCDDSGLTFGGHVSQVLVWNRKITDAEMTALAIDPFGWFSPRRETVTVAAPFPVGPGLAAPGLVHAGFGYR